MVDMSNNNSRGQPWGQEPTFANHHNGFVNHIGAHPAGVPQPTQPNQPSFFNNLLGTAGSAVVNGALVIIEGSTSQYVYVQSYLSWFFADRQYYFQVNDDYVMNKLKMVLCPFLYKGQWSRWSRVAEPMAGQQLRYKPPIYDISAPDLYIPIMSFFSYLVLSALVLGLNGKFNPGDVHFVVKFGSFGWFFHACLLKGCLYYLSRGEATFLETVAYSGYAFAGISLSVMGRLFWTRLNYVLWPWTCLCTAIFLVKTMKRVLYADTRSMVMTKTRAMTTSYDSGRHHQVLLLIALAQFPISFGLVYWEFTCELNFFSFMFWVCLIATSSILSFIFWCISWQHCPS